MHPVAHYDCSIRINGAGNVDVQSAGPAIADALEFDDQRLTGCIGDGTVVDLEFGCTPLGRIVVERKVAIEPVPRAIEPDGDRLDDVESSVSVDGETRIEVPDANGTPLRARHWGERAEDQPDYS